MASDFDGVLFLRGVEVIARLPIASGTVVTIGEMLKYSGSALEVMGATTDNLIFIGIAKEAHAATDPAGYISVALPTATAVYRANLDAAASLEAGANLQAYASAPSTKLTASDTDSIASTVEKTTSLAYIEVVFKIPNKTGGPRMVGDAS